MPKLNPCNTTIYSNSLAPRNHDADRVQPAAPQAAASRPLGTRKQKYKEYRRGTRPASARGMTTCANGVSPARRQRKTFAASDRATRHSNQDAGARRKEHDGHAHAARHSVSVFG